MKVVNLLLLGLLATPAFALPEASLRTQLSATIVPFLQTGKTLTFQTTDGLALAGVYFENPGSTKTIVVINGRTETYLKYGEVFYDLYQKGYSIYSYDHRGQGLSPHLSSVSPQVGYVKSFHSYLEDMDTFLTSVVLPAQKPGDSLYLLAHSMGGAIAAGYLSEYESPFKRAVLSSPMLQINTRPYPELIARAIVDVCTKFGKGEYYAIGYHDYNVDQPFSTNTTTGSEARWWMTNEIYRENPKTILGGPSNNWVLENIRASHWIRNEMWKIKTPFIMFQSEKDQIVKPKGENFGCWLAGNYCTQIQMPDSQHEILMERDVIRDKALSKITEFFE